MYQKMSLDAYRNSFLRIISVIIEIINYPFKLGKMRFMRPFFFSSPSIFSPRSARRVTSLEKRPKLRQWYHDLWGKTVGIRVTVRLRISTSPLFALFICCWMSFETVLGNTEFELVVFGVTLAVVASRSDSGHGVSVLVSVKNSLKKSQISSGNRAVIIA